MRFAHPPRRSSREKSFALVSWIKAPLPVARFFGKHSGKSWASLGGLKGKNITIEYRFAEQKGERLRDLAAELLRLNVDLIMVPDTPSTLAVKNASTTIPIVMTGPADPVGAGLVNSLAQPGGNITGLSSLSPDLSTKRLEILKDAIPKLARVGLLRAMPRPTGTIKPTETDKGCRTGAKHKIGGDRHSTRSQRFRESLSNREGETDYRANDARQSSLFRRKKADRGACRQDIDCLLFTFRRSLSMPAASCPTVLTTLIFIAARLFTWTRF